MNEHSINIIDDKDNSILENNSDNSDPYEYDNVPNEEEIEIQDDVEGYDGTLNFDTRDDADRALLNPSETKEEPSTPKKRKRIYWADCARIFSMISIVLLHCAGFTFEQDLKNNGNDIWHLICICNCLTRFGVPMFVLLSGTFILDPSKKFSFKKLFGHNILRLATAFIFWSTINAICHIYVYHDKKPEEFLKLFIVGEEYLWFIYMIIGCYLISPFLRLFSDDVVLARYFLGLCVLWGSLIPTIRNVFSVLKEKEAQSTLELWTGRWHYHFTLEFVGYFVGGYHIVKYVNIRSVFTRIILYIIGIIDAAAICYLTIYAEYHNNKRYSKDFRDTYTFPIAIYSVILFIFFKHEVGRIEFSAKAISIINKLSSLTFGVYLSHLVIKKIILIFLDVGTEQFFGITVSPVLGCSLCFIVVTLLSFGISYLLSITPILKKYVI